MLMISSSDWNGLDEVFEFSLLEAGGHPLQVYKYS
jgi:hypothetical protein